MCVEAVLAWCQHACHPLTHQPTHMAHTLQFDMTFPHMPCSWLSVDAMDISGEVQLEVDHDVYKRRLASDGTPLDDGASRGAGSWLGWYGWCGWCGWVAQQP